MGLETILERNPIIKAAGKINNPFNRDATTKYIITLLDLIEITRGKDVKEEIVGNIIDNHVPSVKNKNEFLNYINNEHNWIDGILNTLFFEYSKECLQIEDIYRFVGRTTVSPKFLHITVGELFGIEFIYEQVAKLNPNFNSVIDLEFVSDKSSIGHTVIRKKVLEHYKKRLKAIFGEELYKDVIRNEDLITIGVLEGVPKAIDPNNDFAKLVNEPYCESREDDYCEYNIEWTPKPYIDLSKVSIRSPKSIVNVGYNAARGVGKAITAGIIYKLPQVKNLIDRILQMEVVIQKSTEEIRRESEARLQAQRLAAVKETELKLEKIFSGGFAHELRNVLFYGSVEVDDLSKLDLPNLGTLDTKIGELGKAIFDLEQYGVPNNIIYQTILPLIQQIDGISKGLGATIKKYSESTPIIKNSIGRGLVLAQQFLEYSKMQEIKRGDKPVDIYGVAEKIGQKYEKAFIESGITYSIVAPQDKELTITGDYMQLEQILENPIRNAKDALEGKNGKINVSLSKVEKDGVPYLRAVIEDNGMGISEENLKKIFDPFFSTKGSKGTGLGLNFVKKLVEAYRGNISVESKVGIGTTMYIDLPVST